MPVIEINIYLCYCMERQGEYLMADRSRKTNTPDRSGKKVTVYRYDKKTIRKKQRRRRTRTVLRFILLFTALAAIIVTSVWAMKRISSNRYRDAAREEREAEIAAEEAEINMRRAKIAEAELLAQTYDYDGAIDLLTSIDNYEADADLIHAIAKFTAEKTTLQPVDVTKVPHIFYHSLIVDPARAFDENKWDDATIGGTNAWMTTVDEFDKITKQMYENGWVLVRMRDLVKESTDENGNTIFVKNNSLLLPPGKKAYVLSVDDWSYYHSYEGKGYADKAVVDANGDVKCQYTDAQGEVHIGDYDVVPRLNTFLDEHPDAAYKGARGLIAMTGYNGVFGYRTDVAYKTHERLDRDQAAWLEQHPDFSYEKDIEDAKKVAQAVKKSGWEFACHTWGHLSVTGKSVETLEEDHRKWINTVANITGRTDTIIFAHGADIGSWRDYDAETNPVYAFYDKEGYKFYANVDASAKYWVQLRQGYLRQGRIDCDGLQMWRHLSGKAKVDVFEDLFDVKSVFDPARPTPVSATGKA